VDVGAGFGTFGEEMKRVGFFDRVIAVEPAPGLAATCRSKGLEVIEEPIEKVTLAKATVVTCFELIEHLFSPEQFLRACGRVLSKDGLLILTTPNIAGFDLRLLGAISENIDAPEHLNYYHPASLRRLLERCGFLVVEILTPGRLDAELVRKKALAGLVDLTNSPFLRRVLLDDWETLGGPFQDFLAEQGLSSHMWAVARKAADSTVRV
jgi:SAM-dependent methyltransferase